MSDRLSDPAVMLRSELDSLKPHVEMGDDHLPIVRVQFGTPQVASAFGCEVYYPENSLPAAKTHPLKKVEDVFHWKKPGLQDGLYAKVEEYTKVFLKNLPRGAVIQHPDIQSPFNTAHLVRGDDIFTDFYDNPEAVEKLLDLITDFMIDLVPHLKTPISNDPDWFYDWGGLWKGAARISNCSMQMISPEFYLKYVFPRDMRLMQAVGGGRMHYCGRTGEVIQAFLKNPYIYALDYDGRFHDLFKLCEIAPKKTALFVEVDPESETGKRLLAGEWPAKRNLLIVVKAGSIREGRELLTVFRQSAGAH
jgi:hypothetical protein